MTQQVAQTTEQAKPTGNDLAVYTAKTLDISRHIQRIETPIGSINPENRIISDGSMYAGGFYNIRFGPEFIDGTVYARFLKAVAENPKDLSLTSRLNRKIFGANGPKVDDRLVVEYDGTKYQEQWAVQIGQTVTERLVSFNRWREGRPETGEFPLKLKTQIAEQKAELWTNELLLALFMPLIEPLVTAHTQMMKF